MGKRKTTGAHPELAQTLIAMSGQRNVLTVYRPFVLFTGSLEAALMLSQLLYWTPRAVIQVSDNQTGTVEKWIAKTDVEFSQELCLSVYGVRSARKRLENMNILHTRIKKFGTTPMVHYRLDIELLETSWRVWLSQGGLGENAKSDSLPIKCWGAPRLSAVL